MFSVEQRDEVQERLQQHALEDPRVLAAAVVGSLAAPGGGDRWSDLDFSLALADDVAVADVLDDWTRELVDGLDAVHLVDLPSGATTYRVLLLPGALQLDLSMTPAAHFRPAGPRFRLLFGQTSPDAVAPARRAPAHLSIAVPAVPRDVYGWGVVYALHARACIERGRVWQAEHYVGAVRDLALALACLQNELPGSHARGYDDLPADVLARFDGAHVAAPEPDALRGALAVSARALVHLGRAAGLPDAGTIAPRLADLTSFTGAP